MHLPTAGKGSDLPALIRQSKKVLSAREPAELLGCSSYYILKRAKVGNIPCYRISGMARFDPAIAADWLESRRA